MLKILDGSKTSKASITFRVELSHQDRVVKFKATKTTSKSSGIIKFLGFSKKCHAQKL